MDGGRVPFRADWTWPAAGCRPAPEPLHELAALAARLLRITGSHRLLSPESVRWVTRGAAAAGGTLWIPARVDDLAGHIENEVPQPAESLAVTGPTTVLQPENAAVTVPGGFRLHVSGHPAAVTLQTTLDVWFDDRRPELHELNAPRLAACLAEITAELGGPPDGSRSPQGDSPRPPTPVQKLLAYAPRHLPIPWSTEAVETWAQWLRSQLLSAAALPGSRPEARTLWVSEPDQLLRPGEYVQTEEAEVDRGGLTAEESVRAIADRLAANGWRLTKSTATEATAHRLGSRIEVTAWPHTPRAHLTGTTPPVQVYPRRPWERPPRAATAERLDPGEVLCYECEGWGSCPVCEGLGWRLPQRERCPHCANYHTPPQGLCPICRGSGSLSVGRLSPSQRAHYPDL